MITRFLTGQEAGSLFECGNEIMGIEAKWSMGLKVKDLEDLKILHGALDKHRCFGLLLHDGTEAIVLDERTLC